MRFLPPARHCPAPSSNPYATGDVEGRKQSGLMLPVQPARHEEPFFHLASTGDDFEIALRQAARANARSMDQLHVSVRNCMYSLRRDGMQCEAALLTMKSFVKEVCLKHKRRGSPEMLHSDMLMEQIVRWCISDYYAEPEASS